MNYVLAHFVMQYHWLLPLQIYIVIFQWCLCRLYQLSHSYLLNLYQILASQAGRGSILVRLWMFPLTRCRLIFSIFGPPVLSFVSQLPRGHHSHSPTNHLWPSSSSSCPALLLICHPWDTSLLHLPARPPRSASMSQTDLDDCSDHPIFAACSVRPVSRAHPS